jgi:hypothetical protein
MFKLLIWAAVIYGVYRYFQLKERLKQANQQRHIPHDNFQQNPSAPKEEKGGDYIDYEEIK